MSKLQQQPRHIERIYTMQKGKQKRFLRENKEKFAKPYTKQKKYATIYGEFILSDPPHRGIETIYFANRQITSKPAAFRPMVLPK